MTSHGHSNYVRGCPDCQAKNRARIRVYRSRLDCAQDAKPIPLIRRGLNYKQHHGTVAHPPGDPDVTVLCPKCRAALVVYNGNYFCDRWDDGCDWALPHPARKERDRAVCRLLGLDYM